MKTMLRTFFLGLLCLSIVLARYADDEGWGETDNEREDESRTQGGRPEGGLRYPDAPDGEYITIDRRTNVQDHWCCNIEQAPIITNETIPVVLTTYRNKTRWYRAGYEPCGAFGWGRCTKWKILSNEVPITYMGLTFRVTTIYPACPDRHLVCCQGYVRVNSNCIAIEDAQATNKTYQESLDDDLLKMLGGGR